MAVNKKDLAKAVEHLIETTPKSKLATAVAAYLVEQRATKDLESIMRDVQRLRAEKGIVEATLVSAHPFSTSVMSDVKKMIEKQHNGVKKVVINEAVDPTVLGGLRIETGQTQFDTTVRAKLHKLTKANV